MRLDKFLAEVGLGTRSEVKKIIKKGLIAVDGKILKDVGAAVDENKSEVTYFGEVLHYQKYFYYVLHKSAGVVTATKDRDKTVMDLLPEKIFRPDLFPVGRLDKDTEGLLLITNDGALAHDLLSPKKHVEKEYFAEISGMVTDAEVKKFAAGFAIDRGDVVLPSQLKIISADNEKNKSTITLIIHEGKFHQVKRMFEASGMKVTYLKRLRMGSLTLGTLPLGATRALTEKEITELQRQNGQHF